MPPPRLARPWRAKVAVDDGMAGPGQHARHQPSASAVVAGLVAVDDLGPHAGCGLDGRGAGTAACRMASWRRAGRGSRPGDRPGPRARSHPRARCGTRPWDSPRDAAGIGRACSRPGTSITRGRLAACACTGPCGLAGRCAVRRPGACSKSGSAAESRRDSRCTDWWSGGQRARHALSLPLDRPARRRQWRRDPAGRAATQRRAAPRPGARWPLAARA